MNDVYQAYLMVSFFSSLFEPLLWFAAFCLVAWLTEKFCE